MHLNYKNKGIRMRETLESRRACSLVLYINMANFPKAVEGCWGRGLLDDVKWKN